MRRDYRQKYTKPELREQIREDLKASDKGGAPGRWSARKSQMLVQEYERRGGGYKRERNRSEADSLSRWQKEQWETASGDTRARRADVTTRYLPKEVWQQLSPAQRREAERTKEEAERRGQQHVAWPPAVSRAMQKLRSAPPDEPNTSKRELYEKARRLGIAGRSKMSKSELQRAIAKRH